MNVLAQTENRWKLVVALSLWVMFVQFAPSSAESAPVKKQFRVAVVDFTPGTSPGPKNVMNVLRPEEGFVCERIEPEDVINGKLGTDRYDLVVIPGGSGSKQAKALGEQGAKNIKKHVADGGGYMGICAGAYLGSAHYPWSLDLINAKVLDTRHWNRGTGRVVVDFTPVGQKLLGQKSKTGEIYYGQGPLLAPGEHPDLPAYEVLATYATEIAKKGAPKGVMIGTTAICRAPYGDGRVILVSPHPEMKRGLHYLIVNAARWVGGGEN